MDDDDSMPDDAAKVLETHLHKLLELCRERKIVAFAFAADIADRDEKGFFTMPKYGHVQISHGLVASVHKLDALVTAKSLRYDHDDPSSDIDVSLQ